MAMRASLAVTPTCWVVELIGPAGSGKSTILGALRAYDRGIRDGMGLWGQPTPLLFAGIVALIPTIVAALFEGRPLRSAELGQMIRIEAMRWRVRREARRHRGLLVLDEGPIFGLTWLSVFHGSHRGTARARWRARTQQEWAATLRAVVALDAPDQELARRIRSRNKPHLMKSASDDEIDRFNREFRDAYTAVLDDLRAVSAVPVLPVRTESGSSDQTARAVARMIHEVANAG